MLQFEILCIQNEENIAQSTCDSIALFVPNMKDTTHEDLASLWRYKL